MNRNTFNQLIKQGSWHELFITEMGWNAPQGQYLLPTITVDDKVIMKNGVAKGIRIDGDRYHHM